METEFKELKKSKKTPSLRFKEFSGKWKNKKLGKVTQYTKGFAFKSAHYTNNGVRIIRVSDLGKDIIKKNIEKVYLDETHRKTYKPYELIPGNIIITTVGSKPELVESAVGRAIFVENKNEGLLNQNMLKFENTDVANNKFLLGYFYSKKYSHYIKSIARGNANQANITVKDLLEYPIAIPSLPEQQKIASFLSVVDKKIHTLTRKKALLETYKKGVMQKLFSQEVRFKDDEGKDFPEWEEKKLKKLTQIFDGTHSTPEYTTQGIPFYSVEHLTANQFDKTKFIAEKVWEKENKRVKLEKNDVLMTRIGDIGTAKLIDWDVKASFYVSLALLKWNENFNSSYLSQYIVSKRFQKELWKRTIHVAFPKKINLGEIGNCIIQLPQKKEQQKIADFLSAIDRKIEAVSQQIEKTQTFKKGLLQQMFV